MKKIIGHAVLTVILILALVPDARTQVMNFLTVANLQSRSWIFTGTQQFAGGVTAPLTLTGTNGQSNALLTVRPFGGAAGYGNIIVNPGDWDGIVLTASDAALRVYRRISGNKAISLGTKNAVGDSNVIAATNNNAGVKHVETRYNLDASWGVYADYVHRADGTDMTSTLLPRLTVDNTGITTITDVMKLTPRAMAPSSCLAGQLWRQTNGAVCHCVTDNNPENIGSQGVCQ